MIALPEKFVGRLLEDLGDAEARALCTALDCSVPPTAVRLNPFKSGAEFDGEPIGWSRNGLFLNERPSFTTDTAFHAGCYYVQEAGSQFVGHILETTGFGSGRILDMCAAPGGKTTLYSSLVGRTGLVVANEPVRNRASVLADNVRKWGIGNTVVTCNFPSAFANCPVMFDVVAVDAPCSGEGMFRKDERAREEWSENGVGMCAARQLEILEDAWRTLKPGGVLIYSTCTFNRTENEGVVGKFAALHEGELGEAEPIECREEWGIGTGREGVFQTFRFYPHRTRTEGFFVAVARKTKEGDAHRDAIRVKPKRSPMQEVGAAVRSELKRWLRQPDDYCFAMIGETVYAYRREHFDEVTMLAERLGVICSGVEMGRVFGGKLKPEHPLAMFCDLDREAVAAAELAPEDALNYLRKETFDVSPLAEGMNLVTCNGCALGFAKRIGGRCNNLYPNSLRILKM